MSRVAGREDCPSLTLTPRPAGHDDGAVVVPRRRAQRLLADAAAHEEWEVFSRMRIDQGAPLRDYYPLTEATRREYELWRAGGAGAR